MFAKHQEKKARTEYEARLAQWQAQHDSLANALEIAQTFAGESSDEILLKPGESLFAQGTGFSLIEERSTEEGAGKAGQAESSSQSARSAVAPSDTESERARVTTYKEHPHRPR